MVGMHSRLTLLALGTLCVAALQAGCSLSTDFGRAPPDGLGRADADPLAPDFAVFGDGGRVDAEPDHDASVLDHDASEPDDQGLDRGAPDARIGDALAAEAGTEDAAVRDLGDEDGDAGPVGSEVGPPQRDGGTDCVEGRERWVVCPGTPRATRSERCAANGIWQTEVPCRLPPVAPCAEQCQGCMPASPAGTTDWRLHRTFTVDPPHPTFGWDQRPAPLATWANQLIDRSISGTLDGVADDRRTRTASAAGDVIGETCDTCGPNGTPTSAEYRWLLPDEIADHQGPALLRTRHAVNAASVPVDAYDHLLISPDGQRLESIRNDVHTDGGSTTVCRYTDTAVPDFPTEIIELDADGVPTERKRLSYVAETGGLQSIIQEVADARLPGRYQPVSDRQMDNRCWACTGQACQVRPVARRLAYVGFTARPSGIGDIETERNAAQLFCTDLSGQDPGFAGHRLLHRLSLEDRALIGRRLREVTGDPSALAWVDASLLVNLDGTRHVWSGTEVEAPVVMPAGAFEAERIRFRCAVLRTDGVLEATACDDVEARVACQAER